MSKYDLEIDLNSLNDTVKKISDNLLKLKDITNNVNDAYLSLDQSKWIGNDKNKMDASYGIYINKMTNFSDDLMNTINTLNTGLSQYEDIKNEEIKELDNMEDL